MDVKAAAPRATPLLESSWKAAYCDGWSGSGVGRRSVLARPVAGPTRGGLAGAGGFRSDRQGGTFWEPGGNYTAADREPEELTGKT